VRLRHIVPALGVIALVPSVAHAADGGVSIGGFVDTIGSASGTKDTTDQYFPTTERGTYYDFQAGVEVRLGYKITDKVGAKVDVEWNNGTYNGHPNEYLEQAFVNYAVTDMVSLTAGKFTSYAGWISADADGLYRINSGPLTQMYQPDLVGGALNFAPNKDLGVSLFVVNGLGLVDVAGTLDGRTNDNADKFISPAVDIIYNVPDIAAFNLEAGYDYHGSALAAWEVGFNTTIKPKAYDKLTIGAEVLIEQVSDDNGGTPSANTTFGGDASRTGAMLMLNHTIPLPCPASVTLMGQFIEQEDKDVTTTKQKTTEGAIALLTNPTGDAKFGINFEVSYQVTKDAIVLPAGVARATT